MPPAPATATGAKPEGGTPVPCPSTPGRSSADGDGCGRVTAAALAADGPAGGAESPDTVAPAASVTGAPVGAAAGAGRVGGTADDHARSRSNNSMHAEDYDPESDLRH
ncbi:MAG: hypothetical protein OXC11_03610 [Rhodospirillales bacterium]|nr:hypothetical protein [Rhodospirillales bacterium]